MAARDSFLAKVVPRRTIQMDKGERAFGAEDKAIGTTARENDKMGLAAQESSLVDGGDFHISIL